MNTDELVGLMARVRDEDLAGESSDPGAWTLLADIRTVHTMAPPVRRLLARSRLILAAAIVTVVAGGVALLPGLIATSGEVYANETVTIDRDGDDFVFYVTEPDPRPDDLDRSFREAGLDVTVKLIPVSRSQVESVVGGETSDPNARMNISRTECGARVTGCLISFRISNALAGRAVFYLGRQADPDEKYAITADATLPGEDLAGVDIEGRTVREATALIREKSLEVTYALVWPARGPQRGQNLEENVSSSRVNPGWKVAAAETYNDGTIILHVIPGPEADRPAGI